MMSILSPSALCETDYLELINRGSLTSGYSAYCLARQKKRKRTNLDGFSPHEKEERRKVLNRVAAQQSRDRKKQLMANLERKAQELVTQNAVLKRENEELMKKKLLVEKKYEQLLEKFNRISKSTESAVLPFLPQRVICLILLFLALNPYAYEEGSYNNRISPLLNIPMSVPAMGKPMLMIHQLPHRSLSRLFMETPVT